MNIYIYAAVALVAFFFGYKLCDYQYKANELAHEQAVIEQFKKTQSYNAAIDKAYNDGKDTLAKSTDLTLKQLEATHAKYHDADRTLTDRELSLLNR
jgi:hypothetical protein